MAVAPAAAVAALRLWDLSKTFGGQKALDKASLEAWGWRIPFLAGVLIAPLGLYLRSRLCGEADAPADAGPDSAGVLKTVLQRDWRLVLVALFLVVGGT